MNHDDFKAQAGRAAATLVESGMTVGLGTGSTAAHAVRALAERLARGEISAIQSVPTSEATAVLARSLSLPLIPLPAEGVDLAIDGADEVTAGLELIKGLGGALLREKVVEHRARRFVVVADISKRVHQLGERSPLPIEVVSFGYRAVLSDLAEFGDPKLRMDGDELYFTENGHLIVDLHTGPIDDPSSLDFELKGIPGVVETGLFLGMADLALIAGPDGVETLNRSEGGI